MINLNFASEALPEDTFQVLKFDGEEEMSHLFRFELVLVSKDPNIDFEQVLNSHASLAITTQGNTRYIHGILSEFKQAGEWLGVLYEYRAVLVPRLWMMSQSRQNQIHQNQTVPGIVEGEFSSIQQKGGHPLVMTGLDDADYEMHITGDYDEREYVVQYRESDLNFISRLMEHVGIYYYFEHDDTREKIVITDAMAMRQISEQAPVGFQHAAAASNYAYGVVYNLVRSQQQIPGSVLIKDYNYRSPSLPMHATDEVDAEGIGFVTEYGAHFKSPEEGAALATVRAEEFRCRQNIYTGESNVSAFYCGHVYTLMNHFRDEYNRDYLITKVVHHGSQDIESWGNVGGTSYHNEFSCIPADLQYRPERLTPKPRLYGIMNGTIDSEQDTDRADIDEEGRYKVLMPFDISGAAPGKASRRIRMAQPYGGHGAGMSFPLVKGTEVIWTCIDGDIDRPIITGAVPNPLNPSVTTTANNTSNVIKTSSGITMNFHDGSGSAGQNTTGGGAGGGLAAQQQFQSINSELELSEETQNRIVNSPLQTAMLARPDNAVRQPIEQQQQKIFKRLDIAQKTPGTVNLNNAKQWNIGFSYGDSAEPTAEQKAKEEIFDNPSERSPEQELMGFSKDVFFRLGEASEAEIGLEGKESAFAQSGWLSYVDGTRTEITKGDVNRYHYAGVSDYYEAKQFSYAHDNQFGVFAGNKFDAAIGLVGEYRIGGKCESTLGVDVSINSGLKFDFGMSFQYSATAGPDLTLADDIQQEANSSILLAVDPEDEGLDKWMEQSSPWIAAIGAGLSSIPFGIASHKEGHDTSNGLTEGFATTQYVGSAIAAAFATAHYATRKGDNPASFIKMDPNKIDIQVTGVENPTKVGMWRPPGMGTRGSVKPADEKSFLLEVLGNHQDNNSVSLEMKKKGDKGTLELTAGKQTGGGKEPNSEIKLKVGRSSITISDKGIEFNAHSFQFKIDDSEKILITDQTYITSGDLKVISGSTSVGGDLIATGEVHTDKYKHHTGGDAAAAGPKPSTPTVGKTFGTA